MAMPMVNTHSMNSYCSDVSDMIRLFSLNSTSCKCSQVKGIMCTIEHYNGLLVLYCTKPIAKI